MSDYSWIAKKRKKGLSLFQDVLKKMEYVEEHIQRARAECFEERDKLQSDLRDNQAALVFLESEDVATKLTKDKILAFIPRDL